MGVSFGEPLGATADGGVGSTTGEVVGAELLFEGGGARGARDRRECCRRGLGRWGTAGRGDTGQLVVVRGGAKRWKSDEGLPNKRSNVALISSL